PLSAFVLQSIQRTANGERGRFSFYDQNLRLVTVRDKPSYRFDPRTRPWFPAGLREVLVTEPYVFFTSHHLGLSFSQRAPSRGVFGVDLDIADLSDQLARARPSPSVLAAVVEPDGKVLGFDNPLQLATAIRGNAYHPATL